MKKIGIVFIITGLLIMAFAGFRFVTKKKVVEIGRLEITKDQHHILDWSPLLGVVVIMMGGGIYFLGKKTG